MLKLLKYLWVFPVTLIGLLAAGLTAITGGSVQLIRGAIEASGGFAEWIIVYTLRRKVSCMTVGHVILGLDKDNLARARSHEHVHIRQYEKWGLLFIPLYLGSSLLARLQGKRCYRDNIFEREAYAESSGELCRLPEAHCSELQDSQSTNRCEWRPETCTSGGFARRTPDT